MKQQDEKVKKLLEIVEKKKALIKSASKPVWKTNCNYGTRSRETINLHTIHGLDTLIELAEEIISKKELREKANKALGVEVPFSIAGFSSEQWLEDLNTRKSIIEVTKNKKELELLEKKLTSLYSAEAIVEKELSEIESTLNNAD